jgi:hypothetical protein
MRRTEILEALQQISTEDRLAIAEAAFHRSAQKLKRRDRP